MNCPNCGFDSPPEMNFCGRCGERLKRPCPSCDFASPLSFNYCGNCGVQLAGVVRVPGLTPAEAPPPAPVTGLAAPPAPPPVPLEGERREATIMVADVYGSTSLLEHIGTEAWVALMNDVLQIMEGEVERFGGQVDQFRGDGLVAFFGVPTAHEDDPERAVLAALAMQDAVQAYAHELASRRALTLRLRVGVSTGEVIVATIGGPNQYRESTAMGEGVALAARMETAAEPGTVLVGESTYLLVKTRFEWERLTPVSVKGVTAPLPVYRPLRPLPDSDGSKLSRLHHYGITIPLVGREAEFELLKSAVRGLEIGEGGIVLVTGDEGIGKSRLIAEVRRHIDRDRALLADALEHQPPDAHPALLLLNWLRGRCRSYEQTWPYSMWRDLLRRWLGGEDSAAGSADLLRRHCEGLWGDDIAAWYPYLATFLSLPLEEEFAEQVRHLDAEALRQQFYVTIREWLARLASQGPLVIAFGDLHWADPSSLDLLTHCLSLCEQFPLLWLITFRARSSAHAGQFATRVESHFPHRLIHLPLAPLSEAQVDQLIVRLLGNDALSPETRRLIATKADGNPFYVEELIRRLIDQGVLIRHESGDGWRATRPVDSLALPETLQRLLLARIDSLPAPNRQVLQLAAVVGNVFWTAVLKELFSEPGALFERLAALERAHLIAERGYVPALGKEYIFESSSMRDVAYESVLSARRATLHRQIALFLEQQFSDQAPVHFYGMLTYHFRQAGEQARELFYSLITAVEAQKIYANSEALTHYTRGLDILNELEGETTDEQRLYTLRTQKFDVLNERQKLLAATGQYAEARQAARALLPLARMLDDDPVWLIDALLQQPGVINWLSRDELREGLVLSREALALSREIGNKRREMMSLIALARQYHELRDPEALPTTEAALALARELGDRYTEAQLLTTMSGHFTWSDEPERGQAYLDAALPLVTALDEPVSEIRLLREISLRYERYGDYYRVLNDFLKRALELSRTINHRWLTANSAMHYGQVEGIYLGALEDALPYVTEARQLWRDTPLEGVALLRVAQIESARDNYEAALTALREAHEPLAHNYSELARCGSWLTKAIVSLAIGDEDHRRRALEAARQARRVALETPRLSHQFEIAAGVKVAAAHLALAEHAASEAEQQEHATAALSSSTTALQIYERYGYMQVIECVSEEVLFTHARSLAAKGRQADANSFFQRAYNEMMRKHALIPAQSPYRQSYLEAVPLHRAIQTAVDDGQLVARQRGGRE